MRVGLVWERKASFPFAEEDPDDVASELLSREEEDEIISGLRDAGHDVILIGGGHRLIARPGYWRERCDLVLNKSVGFRGVDRKSVVAGVLEAIPIPYVGSTPYALALTRHKHHAKLVVASVGVSVAPGTLITRVGLPDTLNDLSYPCIVKPVAESSSIGVSARSVVGSPHQARERAHEVLARYRQPAIVEQFVEGAEVEVPLIAVPGFWPLGVVGFRGASGYVEDQRFLTTEQVFVDDYSFASPPPYVDVDRVLVAASLAADALGIRDYGRIDFRVRRDGTPVFIEASTHPHIQRHSSFFFLQAATGASYSELLDTIVRAATVRLGLPL